MKMISQVTILPAILLTILYKLDKQVQSFMNSHNHIKMIIKITIKMIIKMIINNQKCINLIKSIP